jgi:LysR family glycine cleavage system transcriptional activator
VIACLPGHDVGMTSCLPRPAHRWPPLPAIRAFEAAARLGSFERASEELALSASAVGKRVGNLEQLLGVKLLVRRARGVDLSPAGLEYLAQVRAALDLLSAAPLHQRSVARRIVLKVSTPPTFGRELLVPHLAAYSQQWPDVDVDVLLSVPYLGAGQGSGGADVTVLATRAGEPGLVPLMDDALVAVCHPAYAQRLALNTPADLARATLVRSPPETWRPWLAAAGLDWPEPTQGPRLLDMGLAMSAAQHGVGVALARSSLVERAVQAGELTALFGVRTRPSTAYGLVIADDCPDDGTLQAALQFADWLRGVCRNQGADRVVG